MKSRKVETVRAISLDIYKNVFQLHRRDAKRHVVLKRQLRRVEVARFFAELPPRLVGIEACAGGKRLGTRADPTTPRRAADAAV